MTIKTPTILEVRDKTEFCSLFSIDPRLLSLLINDDFRNTSIEELHLSKKRGGYRCVYKINNPQYKWLLRQISTALGRSFTFDDYVQGFTQKKSIFSNAELHLCKKVIIHCDIQNFFENIKDGVILFTSLGFNDEISQLLNSLCFYQNHLPAGFPTSPILSNLYCQSLDKDLYTLSESRGYTYSRYGDDMTFSTNSNVIISENDLSTILFKHGFPMNKKKFRIERKGGSQYVTGLTVVDKKSPHVPRKLKQKIRLELYYIEKFGLEKHLSNASNKSIRTIFSELCIYEIKGWIGYLSKTEKSLIRYIKSKHESIKNSDLANIGRFFL